MADAAFGSSGIRGPWGRTVTPELALDLGRVLGRTRDRVVVGRDGRTSGPPLTDALVSGLAASGAEVVRAGVASTPAIAYAARDHDAAVAVTASHNPPSDGGFKLLEPDGRGCGPKARERIERGLDEGPPADAAWDAIGAVRDDPDVTRRHVTAVVDHVASRLDADLAGLRVAVDGGHGPAGRETADALVRLGADVTTVNASVDGTFPGRPSRPTPGNLAALRDLVARDHDLGLAHDGDGDRLVAVAGDGEVVPGDRLIAVLARGLDVDELACPVDVSRAVDDALPEAKIHRTPVGDVHVAEALARTGAAFGAETTGSIILREVSGCPDGPLAAATVAALAATRPLTERVAELPAYPLTRRSFPVPEEAKPAVVDRLRDRLASMGEATTLDGIRVDVDEGWILVRPSGTEPKIRLTVEARDPADLDELEDEATDAIQAVLDEVVR